MFAQLALRFNAQARFDRFVGYRIKSEDFEPRLIRDYLDSILEAIPFEAEFQFCAQLPARGFDDVQTGIGGVGAEHQTRPQQTPEKVWSHSQRHALKQEALWRPRRP